MKWIKLSERKPVLSGDEEIVFRDFEGAKKLIEFWDIYDPKKRLEELCHTQIEWLDESPSGSEAWVSVEERLPDYDIDVLIYWKLTRNPKEGGYYDMIEIAHVQSITTAANRKSVEWVDREYHAKDPTHWQPLPQPPIK